MNTYEVMLHYYSLRLHFTGKFDYFKYGAVERVVPKVVKPNERGMFEYVSSLAEPKTFLVGNFIFNDVKYISAFDHDSYMTYRSYLTNGAYYFSEDIKKLKKPFGENFRVDGADQIPYIVKLLMKKEVSIYTACALHKLLHWADKVDNDFVSSTIQTVIRSYRFFKVNDSQLKSIILNHYKS